MNSIRSFHNRDATVRLALIPFLQVTIVHLAVAVTARDRLKSVARIQPEVALDVVSGPTVSCDGPSMLQTEDDGTVTAQHGGVGGNRTHRRARRIQNALRIVAMMVRHAVWRFRRHREHR